MDFSRLETDEPSREDLAAAAAEASAVRDELTRRLELPENRATAPDACFIQNALVVLLDARHRDALGFLLRLIEPALPRVLPELRLDFGWNPEIDMDEWAANETVSFARELLELSGPRLDLTQLRMAFEDHGEWLTVDQPLLSAAVGAAVLAGQTGTKTPDWLYEAILERIEPMDGDGESGQELFGEMIFRLRDPRFLTPVVERLTLLAPFARYAPTEIEHPLWDLWESFGLAWFALRFPEKVVPEPDGSGDWLAYLFPHLNPVRDELLDRRMRKEAEARAEVLDEAFLAHLPEDWEEARPTGLDEEIEEAWSLLDDEDED